MYFFAILLWKIQVITTKEFYKFTKKNMIKIIETNLIEVISLSCEKNHIHISFIYVTKTSTSGYRTCS